MTRKQKAQDVLNELKEIIGRLPSQPFTKADLKLEAINDKLDLLAYYTGLELDQ